MRPPRESRVRLARNNDLDHGIFALKLLDIFKLRKTILVVQLYQDGPFSNVLSRVCPFAADV